MKTGSIEILGISGSLRQGSSASAVLENIGKMIGATASFSVYGQLEKIPPFNDSDIIPPVVAEFIEKINEADAVFFCIPEYALGVPGALKNALDWTVASTAFSGKPVALVTAASGGEKAHAAFSLTLTALGSKVRPGTSLVISFIRSKMNEKKELVDPALISAVQKVIAALFETIEERKAELLSWQ